MTVRLGEAADMTARSYIRSGARSAGTETRLPWWALALPVIAFVSLLSLMVGPAHSAAAQDGPMSRVVDHVQQLLVLRSE
jgi:hypothetical protein